MPSLRESDPILVKMKRNELKSSLKPGLAVLRAQKIPLSSAQSDSDQAKSNENDEKIPKQKFKEVFFGSTKY